MNTGYIRIIGEEGKTPYVEAELVNGNVWMSRYAICQFFGCFQQKIDANLRSIFQSKLLTEDKVSYTYRYTDRGVEKQIEYYNLEVLIFLSYRIGTHEAEIFRQFINSALREHLMKKEMEKYGKLIWYFRKKQTKDYWLN
jgi:hypothetical protein